MLTCQNLERTPSHDAMQDVMYLSTLTYQQILALQLLSIELV